ncbi:MAG: NAD-dependent epimerase/dehydratase family protein [Hyphomicrobiales bacterium]
MSVLVTGVAGFIGFHTAKALLERGDEVIGIDNLNDYYDMNLKMARLSQLENEKGFSFHKADLADFDGLNAALSSSKISKVIHLAAQAGVRHSIENPHTYATSNLIGHLNALEFCRHHEPCKHLVYASSSSVYGGNTKLPFSESDRVDQPISLYAATKKADELMSQSYAHLYRLPQTGLRFFTVYGPWGRPDMAMWLFADAIVTGKPIRVFNHGDMERDFTYIDDIVAGVLAVCDAPPDETGDAAPHRIYNIGNNRPEPLLRMIDLLETALGRKAIRQMEPMQPGDVRATYADIDAISTDHGFSPAVPLEEGIERFVTWYKHYHGLN